MLVVPAIVYFTDQHEPSEPFLLELNCPETPTKGELERAMVERARESLVDEDDLIELEEPMITVSDSRWGLQAEYEDTYLIVGLPEQLKGLFANESSGNRS